MGMDDCRNCTEKCPQAEMAHEIALGRMYATNELVKLVKQVESGQLVDVIRCKDCINYNTYNCCDGYGWCENLGIGVHDDFFCKIGERKENG